MSIQRLRLVVPPTLAELLENDVYAAWFRKNPRMPSVTSENPWQIIARRSPDQPGSTWAVRLEPSYETAYRRARRMLKDPRWEDVSVCSRGTTFRPPLGFGWSLRFYWCGRCRRPSLFSPMRTHPVVSASPRADAVLRHAMMLSSEKPERCYYCGIRRSALPRHEARLR